LLTKAICRRSFTPAQPDCPAASVRDFLSGAYIRQLRAWCERMGYAVAGEYVEHESGGKSADHRKQLAQVFADASRRDFDMLLVWALDRFSREGMAATVVYLQRLSSYGVGFHSYSEEHLSTDNELVRNILLAPSPRWRSSNARKSVSAPRPTWRLGGRRASRSAAQDSATPIVSG